MLIAEIRLGDAFNIERFLPGRLSHNLIVFCPACPEAGFNEEEGVERTPHEYRSQIYPHLPSSYLLKSVRTLGTLLQHIVHWMAISILDDSRQSPILMTTYRFGMVVDISL